MQCYIINEVAEVSPKCGVISISHWFIQQMFTEHMLYIRPFLDVGATGVKKTDIVPALMKLIFYTAQTSNKQVNI